jgi:hypothetical protein
MMSSLNGNPVSAPQRLHAGQTEVRADAADRRGDRRDQTAAQRTEDVAVAGNFQPMRRAVVFADTDRVAPPLLYSGRRIQHGLERVMAALAGAGHWRVAPKITRPIATAIMTSAKCSLGNQASQVNSSMAADPAFCGG